MGSEKRYFILAVALAVGAVQARTVRADIIVTDWRLTTAANDNDDPSSFDVVRHETVAFPLHDTHTAASGPTSAQLSYDFALDGNSATFDFAFSLARSPSESRALGSGWIDFITTEPVPYSIAGGLAMSGTGTLVLRVVLVELEYPNPHLYIGDHASRSTSHESFALGTLGGDLGWTESGNRAGTLLPDVAYELFYYYELKNFPVTNSDATAQGILSFAFIPEPCTLALCAIGGLLVTRRRRGASLFAERLPWPHVRPAMSLQVRLCALAVVLIQPARLAMADITVTDWSLTTRARDDFRPFIEQTHEMVTLPFHETHTAVDGPTIARSGYNFEVGEEFALFQLNFDFSRSPSLSRGESLGGITFLSTEPLEYDLAGSLDLSGTGILVIHVLLVDFSTSKGELVYSGYHDSRATANESFTLGMAGGDTSSREEGNLSGVLTAGTPYGLFYDYWTENYPVDDNSASATGSLSFVLTPEPGSALLLVLGGLVLIKRRI